MKNRALVISGGGALGSFAGGLSKKLYDLGLEWNMFYGTSTGALLNTLIPNNEWKSLQRIYTSVSNSDIYSRPPFTSKGRIKYLSVLWNTLRGKTSIGKADNLLRLIKRTFPQESYDNTLLNEKIVCACVTNFTTGKVEYGYNTTHSYDDFVKYVFASASVPIAMDLVKIGEYEYMDGGVIEHIPIQQAINDGAEEIDAILLRPDYSEIFDSWESKNVVNVALRSIQLMMREISESDLVIGKLKSKGKTVKINFFYMPSWIKGNSLVFDKQLMAKWWDAGYNLPISIEIEPITKENKIDMDITIQETVNVKTVWL